MLSSTLSSPVCRVLDGEGGVRPSTEWDGGGGHRAGLRRGGLTKLWRARLGTTWQAASKARRRGSGGQFVAGAGEGEVRARAVEEERYGSASAL
jgi:hypothetical protein